MLHYYVEFRIQEKRARLVNVVTFGFCLKLLLPESATRPEGKKS